MRIIFVRHAESENNAKDRDKLVNFDTELTEKWHKQAELLAQYIATKAPDYILSSPRVRSLQTAQYIAEAAGLDVHIAEDLQERKRGDRGGYTREDVKWILNEMDIEERYTYTPHGGESWKDMEQRLLKELDAIVHSEKECIVIVTHKWCLRALMRLLLQGDLTEHEQFGVAMASCSVVTYVDWSYQLESRNEISHLWDLS